MASGQASQHSPAAANLTPGGTMSSSTNSSPRTAELNVADSTDITAAISAMTIKTEGDDGKCYVIS